MSAKHRFDFAPSRSGRRLARSWRLVALATILVAPQLRAGVPLEDFARRDLVEFAKLSPDGKYIAVSFPVNGTPGLVVERLADRKVTAKISAGPERGILDVWWASPERMVLTLYEQQGSLAMPAATGELIGVNADSTGFKYLFGFRGDVNYYGSKGETFAAGYADVIATLPSDPRHVLIAARIGDNSLKSKTFNLFRLDVDTGERSKAGEMPAAGAPYIAADAQGVVRYVQIFTGEEKEESFIRKDESAPWESFEVRKPEQPDIRPLGLSADGMRLFELAQEASNGDRMCVDTLDLASRKRTTLSCDPEADAERVIYAFDHSEPIAAVYALDRPKIKPFDANNPDVVALQRLAKSFPDSTIEPLSASADRKLVIVLVHGDRNPGDYYLYDARTNKAAYVMSRREWLHPEDMAPREPIQFPARDGTILHGYLTRPVGAKGPVPLVVNPHGGPFSAADTWDFDDDAQLLANRGYAVLQVNYRGSSGRGKPFENAARRRWNTMMIDDLTDGAHWAIDRKVTAPGRLCIFGVSYGGFAAMASVEREPNLYRCAIAYSGIYDLSRWAREFDNGRTASGRRYVHDYVGESEAELDAESPLFHLDTLKSALFIVHGLSDARVPYTQAESLMAALDERHYPYEKLVRFQEVHGFYSEGHRVEFYNHMLAFLNRYLPLAAPDGSGSTPGGKD